MKWNIVYQKKNSTKRLTLTVSDKNLSLVKSKILRAGHTVRHSYMLLGNDSNFPTVKLNEIDSILS